ncbi:hypothetical protein GGP94_003022 [Salinibacter ruber]|jgi:hypothetical protein|uniref:hypothetical protein n=1 Tax=Salinibacter ruber TaxID=146919 RepID=UPI0021675257|nr:hypothetical protein [Salinibacter ruber]MCS4162577.1 hypothetical protein [Salinibacter ruber]
MLTYFISHPSPSLPPPRFEEPWADAKADMAKTYDLIGEPEKKREIHDAIRRVLDRGGVPSGKIKSYKAADKERGLSGNGRATGNCMRGNEHDPLPGPDYWREKFNLWGSGIAGYLPTPFYYWCKPTRNTSVSLKHGSISVAGTAPVWRVSAFSHGQSKVSSLLYPWSPRPAPPLVDRARDRTARRSFQPEGSSIAVSTTQVG